MPYYRVEGDNVAIIEAISPRQFANELLADKLPVQGVPIDTTDDWFIYRSGETVVIIKGNLTIPRLMAVIHRLNDAEGECR